MNDRKWLDLAGRQLFWQAVTASGTLILGTAAVLTLLLSVTGHLR